MAPDPQYLPLDRGSLEELGERGPEIDDGELEAFSEGSDEHRGHFKPPPLLEEGVYLTVREKKRLWWWNSLISSVFIASWFLFATILSLYNKWMFSPDQFGFPFPLFVTSNHFFVQFILAGTLRTAFPKTFRPQNRPSVKDYGTKAVPCAVATSLDIGLSNLSLKTITLSFYTMCKSSSLIFVLLFAFIFRLERFSYRLVGVIFLITSGVVLMVATETKFVLVGMILVITASAMGGLRWSLTQVLLSKEEMGMDTPCSTLFWLAPSMGITLMLVTGAVEGFGNIFGSQYFQGFWPSMKTMVFLVSPGSVAFCMVLSEFYIIQRTGVVPMSIAGIFKEVTTITLSTWVFGDKLTPVNTIGVGITVCGIALFTYHKYQKSIETLVTLDSNGKLVPVMDEVENTPVFALGEEEDEG